MGVPRGSNQEAERAQRAVVYALARDARPSPRLTLGDDLEPLSFDDLPLGGEWTTRRRTVSEAEIALFAGVAGDLSPLTIDASRDGRREAPPAMVVALAVGLGSVDTPVPAVAEWEWLNWKFPRPIHAGETIYAHWMLTQKRPPSSGSSASIVVWRVDVHTADGALCAEGEIGAKVVRSEAPKQVAEQPAAAGRTGRRRRRPRTGNGTPVVAEPPAIAAPPAPAAKPERAAGPSRRRRRRRSSSSSSASAPREEDHEPRAAHVSEIAPAVPEPPPPPARAPERQPATAGRKGLGGVLRRLRGS